MKTKKGNKAAGQTKKEAPKKKPVNKVDWKRIVFYTSIIVLFSTFFGFHSEGEKSMKLVNNQNGFVVVEFDGNEAKFHDDILEKQLMQYGIKIPPNKRENFQGRDTVYPGDDGFADAFKDVYASMNIDPKKYSWKE